MLQLIQIRDNKEEVIQRLAVKNFEAKHAIEKVIQLDEDRRKTQQILDEKLNRANIIAKEIGQLFKEKKVEAANKLKDESNELKENTKQLSAELNSLEKEIEQILVTIPNIPSVEVCGGKSAEDNIIVAEYEGLSSEMKTPVPHWEIADKYDIINFELGNKITGSGFPVYKGKGAKLQRALISFFLDCAEEVGYQEVMPPLLVNEASGFGTGQLPDKEGQMYYVGADNLYLIPTAEVPITNIFRDTILNENDLPLKYTGYTPCFRREAGSYGKDVRGLNRLHQFDKVEIVQVVHPKKSYAVLEDMVNYVKTILEKLGLKYRVVKLCGGDMSFASALTYDFEVYSVAQKMWLEVSSVSNFETYQSNRLKLRFKDSDNKKHLAHTLNGSALALPRIVAAILENNQVEKGVKIPEALRKYTGFDIIN